MENNQEKSLVTPSKTKKKSVIKDTLNTVKNKVISTVKKNDKKSEKKQENKTSDVKKIKLLVTVVDRNKTLFYEDLLEQYEINMQIIFYGHGTAAKDMLDYLGLASVDKSVIYSFVREDKVKEILQVLNEKFEKVRNGKGIAYTIPLQSIIGVSNYQFLTNNQTIKKEEK